MRRPAILRKDFIVDEYQLLEARANGADTVLLIVAVLEVDRLDDLIQACRKLDMEPLVEVCTIPSRTPNPRKPLRTQPFAHAVPWV